LFFSSALIIFSITAGSELFDEGLRFYDTGKKDQALEVFKTLNQDTTSAYYPKSNYYLANLTNNVSDMLNYLTIYLQGNNSSEKEYSEALRKYLKVKSLTGSLANIEEYKAKLENDSLSNFLLFRLDILENKTSDAYKNISSFNQITGLPKQRLDEAIQRLGMRIGENIQINAQNLYGHWLSALNAFQRSNQEKGQGILLSLTSNHRQTEPGILAYTKLDQMGLINKEKIIYRLMLGPYSNQNKIKDAEDKLSKIEIQFETTDSQNPEGENWKRIYFGNLYNYQEAIQLRQYIREKIKLPAMIVKQ
jgi:hypothetical protein